MSELINLAESLFLQGQHLYQVGRKGDARRILDRLTQLSNLPTPRNVNAWRLLGELHLEAHRYRKARRALMQVLQVTPDDAECHFLLGRAIELDPRANLERAAKHYRRATKLEPREPRYWASLGQVLLALDKQALALKAFRRAVGLGPEEAGTIEDIVDGLQSLGYGDEAADVLTVVRFRMAKGGQGEQLVQQYRFRIAREKQRKKFTAETNSDEVPTILPLIRVSPQTTSGRSERFTRHDEYSEPVPHLSFLLAQRQRQRKAN
jgi:tetratricopeptide (TPR) repeat protein